MSAQQSTKFPSFNWMRGVSTDTRITVILRFVLLNLMIERDNHGRCQPGYDLLAKKLGVHRVTVIRAVEAGVRYGWLASPIRHRRESAEFVFTFPQEVAPQRHQKRDQEVAPEQHQDNQEVAPQSLRSNSPVVKKSLRQRASRENSTACETHGPKKGQKKGQKKDSRVARKARSARERDGAPDFGLGKKKRKKEDSRGKEAPSGKIETEPQAPEKNQAGADVGDAFARFWAVYPRHDAQEPARKAFARAIKDTDPEIIIARAKVYALTEQARLARPGQTTQHTLMAVNWLRGQRWTDPLPDGVVVDNESGEPVAYEPEEEPERLTALDIALQSDGGW